MRYEIDENNAVWIYEDGNETAFCFQPDWPDTTPWADKAEAETWAIAKIAELTDPEAPLAGTNPANPTEPRPVDHRANAFAKLEALGLTPQEIISLSR